MSSSRSLPGAASSRWSQCEIARSIQARAARRSAASPSARRAAASPSSSASPSRSIGVACGAVVSRTAIRPSGSASATSSVHAGVNSIVVLSGNAFTSCLLLVV
jgi:hypothetical protein